MGAIVCLVIVGLFAFLVMRTFARLLAEQNLFVFLAVAGLVTNFGLQAVVNIGSSLHLLPTKGMTLPFISYGGSSLIALADRKSVVQGTGVSVSVGLGGR